jgi:hypothetical protein
MAKVTQIKNKDLYKNQHVNTMLKISRKAQVIITTYEKDC